jgi:hypothetical protein
MADTETHAARSLPEEKRLEYLIAVASLVYADGDVDETELAVLRKLGAVLEITPAGMEKVVAAAKSPDHAQVAGILAHFRGEDLRYALLATGTGSGRRWPRGWPRRGATSIRPAA